jgi:hypothetical protein
MVEDRRYAMSFVFLNHDEDLLLQFKADVSHKKAEPVKRGPAVKMWGVDLLVPVSGLAKVTASPLR